MIIFDGYPVDATEKSIKRAERLRRSRKEGFADIIFNETIVCDGFATEIFGERK